MSIDFLRSVYKMYFLDHDVVINLDRGFVSCQLDFEFEDGVIDLVRVAHKLKYKVVAITNQAGSALGYYTEEQFHHLSNWMCQQFSAAYARIARVYCSACHPTAGLGRYLNDDFFCKLHPRTILHALQDLIIDLSRSVLEGDKVSDIQAGTAAGVATNLLFAAERPNELVGLNFELMANLREVIPYSQRGAQ